MIILIIFNKYNFLWGKICIILFNNYRMMYVLGQVLKMVHVIQLRNVQIVLGQPQDPVPKAMEFVALVSKVCF